MLPPAQEIEALERTIPEAGERLLRLVEREAEHRQVLEKQIVAADNFRANLGLIAGIVMAIEDWRHRWNWCDSNLDCVCISGQESILNHAC